jgi:hypothetical protein
VKLSQLIPPAARRSVYLLAFLAWLAVTAWQAGGGHWKAAGVAFVTALVHALAGGNVTDSRELAGRLLVQLMGTDGDDGPPPSAGAVVVDEPPAPTAPVVQSVPGGTAIFPPVRA